MHRKTFENNWFAVFSQEQPHQNKALIFASGDLKLSAWQQNGKHLYSNVFLTYFYLCSLGKMNYCMKPVLNDWELNVVWSTETFSKGFKNQAMVWRTDMFSRPCGQLCCRWKQIWHFLLSNIDIHSYSIREQDYLACRLGPNHQTSNW